MENEKNKILNKEEIEKADGLYYEEINDKKPENQNQTHNIKKQAMGPNTRR
ncbi:hypothetical protein [Anaeromicropila herbilytica]|uniref:Uncharacterized protein n=1 Tax=Anaeromicropila herbilytica TaxID=2785025 RepID=A0A7R7EMB9_9FIRM|nr:hypothetical protein [Anaeromicropila herbilytica]BCN31220.1 hypothetical protein bsdtb5_25150 [Anaeromicropila herbilytica]